MRGKGVDRVFLPWFAKTLIEANKDLGIGFSPRRRFRCRDTIATARHGYSSPRRMMRPALAKEQDALKLAEGR
jgi:hypothetical protein